MDCLKVDCTCGEYEWGNKYESAVMGMRKEKVGSCKFGSYN